MRAGVLISAVGHVVLVSLALLGTPRVFDESTKAVEVELVSSEDAPKEPEKPEKPKEPEKTEYGWDPLPDKPAPWPDAAQVAPAAQSTLPTTRPPQPTPPAKQQTQVADAKQAAPTTAQPSPQPQPQAQPPKPSIFDPASIPALLDLPNAPSSGFDAESTSTANISGEERAAFKAHLKRCSKLPGGVSPAGTTRVVLRIYLRRDGSLASEPVLVEASASREGPLLLQAAQRALKECQPFDFLPADRYSEWRVLDLSFTPRDMAGG